jgi:hypothetical protein
MPTKTATTTTKQRRSPITTWRPRDACVRAPRRGTRGAERRCDSLEGCCSHHIEAHTAHTRNFSLWGNSPDTTSVAKRARRPRRVGFSLAPPRSLSMAKTLSLSSAEPSHLFRERRTAAAETVLVMTQSLVLPIESRTRDNSTELTRGTLTLFGSFVLFACSIRTTVCLQLIVCLLSAHLSGSSFYPNGKPDPSPDHRNTRTIERRKNMLVWLLAHTSESTTRTPCAAATRRALRAEGRRY